MRAIWTCAVTVCYCECSINRSIRLWSGLEFLGTCNRSHAFFVWDSSFQESHSRTNSSKAQSKVTLHTFRKSYHASQSCQATCIRCQFTLFIDHLDSLLIYSSIVIISFRLVLHHVSRVFSDILLLVVYIPRAWFLSGRERTNTPGLIMVTKMMEISVPTFYTLQTVCTTVMTVSSRLQKKENKMPQMNRNMWYLFGCLNETWESLYDLLCCKSNGKSFEAFILLLLSQIYFTLSVFIDCWQHLEVKVLTFNHDRRKKWNTLTVFGRHDWFSVFCLKHPRFFRNQDQ